MKIKAALKRKAFLDLYWRIAEDYQYRTIVFTYVSLIITLLVAAGKLVMGCLLSSLWFITLAVYYFILSIVRFMVLKAERRYHRLRNSREKLSHEKKICRRSGLLLFVLTAAVLAMVWFMVYQEKGHRYPGTIIYLVALFSFYKAIFAIVNLHRTIKTGSILLATIRRINYADALVSVLSLQTAMLASFSEGDMDVALMNTLTGNGVCILILLMAVYMIRFPGGRKKTINKTETQLQQNRNNGRI